MQTALYYLLGLGVFALAAGGIIAFFALRDAPEGFENEEGFVGVTKGDEVLLKQFARERHFSAIQGRMDLAA
jgi:hypothetical protein